MKVRLTRKLARKIDDVDVSKAAVGDVARDPGAQAERRARRALAGQPRAEAKRAPIIHPGVRRVLTYLRHTRTTFDNLSLKALAGIANLSPSRFMHVFTESVGVPVRPYILWLRLQRAACDLMDGATVTNAAHRAGFSDGAHLTHTFRRMLGTSPSDLALDQRLSRKIPLESVWTLSRSLRCHAASGEGVVMK